MTQPEYNQPRPMSDFSLPRLKDVDPKDRREVMQKAWIDAVNWESTDAVMDVQTRWETCMDFFSESAHYSDEEVRWIAKEWSWLVKTVITYYCNELIRISGSEGKGDVKKVMWNIQCELARWSDAIEKETRIPELLDLIQEGIEHLKSANLSPQNSEKMLYCAAADEVRKRNGL